MVRKTPPKPPIAATDGPDRREQERQLRHHLLDEVMNSGHPASLLLHRIARGDLQAEYGRLYAMCAPGAANGALGGRPSMEAEAFEQLLSDMTKAAIGASLSFSFAPRLSHAERALKERALKEKAERVFANGDAVVSAFKQAHGEDFPGLVEAVEEVLALKARSSGAYLQ